VEGRALEEHELPFTPTDANSVLSEYRKLDNEVRLRVVQRLALIIDKKYGNSEIDPTDVLDPAEITALMLGLEPEELAQALVEALENKTPKSSVIQITSSYGHLLVDRSNGAVLESNITATDEYSEELAKAFWFDIKEYFTFRDDLDRDEITHIDVCAILYHFTKPDGSVGIEEPAYEWREDLKRDFDAEEAAEVERLKDEKNGLYPDKIDIAN
jgi:hypothetical protein